ncbi:gliding motility-associated C-terminal domain-containing protein [Flavobacterium sp. J27]|uniref:T9SS type B sorting domain-containing protein n=1 Tax=Flavobacterium sp. J27 TaxID=2060419 RepID=UPI0010323A10|nr:gliding motility-associated C-terminal domain-containing protein [Flavobacterium sp. J27]
MWFKNLKYILLFTIAFVFNSYANTITKNMVFQTPSIQNVRFPGFSFTDPNVAFCQSSSNPDHELTFQVTNYINLSAGNQFQLFLSNDDFATQNQITNVSIAQTSVSGTTATYTATFSFPAQTYGNNFKIRVRSTTLSSFATSQVFSAYDIIFNNQIPLNVTNGSVILCANGSFTISIKDDVTPTPLTYSYLTYIWRKQNLSTGIFEVIPNQTGPSLTVTTSGTYFVEVNYGPICSSSASPNTLAKSVQVTVTQSTSGDTLQIASQNGETEVCESTGVLLLLQDSSGNLVANGSNISWYLNGVVIPNANSNTYNATQGGAYTASLNNGSCTISVPQNEAYVLNEITFNATLNVSTPYELTIGDNFDAIVTTDAISPSFEWYFNNNILTETTNTLNIAVAGQYTVIITENSGCISTIELNLLVIEPGSDVIPNLISPNGDGINDKFKVPYNLTSSNNLSLEIYNSSGKQVYVTDNYQNTWPENDNDAFESKAFYYFKMTKESQIIKEGILTVIK